MHLRGLNVGSVLGLKWLKYTLVFQKLCFDRIHSSGGKSTHFSYSSISTDPGTINIFK